MRNQLCIPVDTWFPNNLMIIQQVLVHDCYNPSAIGGHLGVEKTLEKLTMLYYWPNMTWYVKWYIVSCDIC